jgi:DNA-directed RNA polymerase alpha subunit
MATAKKNIRICANGHQYYKSSDCPSCPVCEEQRKPQSGFLSRLSAPAKRALENKGIKTLQQLSAYSETEILSLHGMGKTTVPKLTAALQKAGLSFKAAE